MWTYRFSNGFKSSTQTQTVEETLFFVATQIKKYLYNFPSDGIPEDEFIKTIPDIYIYKDGILNEIIKGVDLYEN